MSRQNVILIVNDALRADRLGCYCNTRNFTPNMDEIANNGILFEKCFSTFNATDPAFTTIFSGLYPLSHGIRTHADRIDPAMLQKLRDSKASLISEVLQKNGYYTIGIDWLGRWHKRGFDYYLGEKLNTKRPLASALTDEAIQQIADCKTPFFLFIHYWDSHTPYLLHDAPGTGKVTDPEKLKIPEIFTDISNPQWKQYLIDSAGSATNAGEVIAAYDSSVGYLDREIGRLFTALKEKNLFKNTMIIITSDHGESLTEHGIFFDHHGLYDASIQVPLIIGNLASPPQRVKELVQHPDIAPTLYDLLGISFKPDLLDGESLVPLMNGEKKEGRPFIVSEESWTEKKIAIRSSEWKYIMARSTEDATCNYCGCIHGGVEELYDLITDPGETLNCIEAHPDIAQKYRRLLSEWEENIKKIPIKRKIKRMFMRLMK